MPRACIGLEYLHGHTTVDARKLHVHQDQGWLVLQSKSDTGFPGFRFEGNIALKLQHITNQFEISRIVFDNEDECTRHGYVLSPKVRRKASLTMAATSC